MLNQIMSKWCVECGQYFLCEECETINRSFGPVAPLPETKINIASGEDCCEEWWTAMGAVKTKSPLGIIPEQSQEVFEP